MGRGAGRSFWAELKRRKVFRVAVMYSATAFVGLQAADIMLPRLGVPEGGMTLIVVLVILGFPTALLLGWLLEVTPEGVRVTPVEKAPDLDDPSPPLLGRGTVLAAGVLVILGLGIGAGWFLRPGPPGVSGGSDLPFEKSIAVLPFADFSPAGDQEWFADGLSEEILHALSRTPDLVVAPRTSSFRYKETTLDAREIARELGVAHIVQGAVRSTTERIRVTVQLIRASDGLQVWSESYDRDPANVIEIQEDLARRIAIAMETSMDPQALIQMAEVGTRSVEAYRAYVRGLSLSRLAPSQEGYVQFELARGLDPGFAAAHFRAAEFWLEQLDVTRTGTGQTDLQPAEVEGEFFERIDRAIETAHTPSDRLGYEAVRAIQEFRFRRAIELSRRYVADRPGQIALWREHLFAARYQDDRGVLVSALGELWPLAQLSPEAAFLYANFSWMALDREEVGDRIPLLLERWPDEPLVWYQGHRALLGAGQVAPAREAAVHLHSMDRLEDWMRRLVDARQACAEGRRADAEEVLAATPEEDLVDRWLLLSILGRTKEAAALLTPLEEAGQIHGLAGFLAYPEFDPSPFPSLMQILEREGVDRSPPVRPAFACPEPDAV